MATRSNPTAQSLAVLANIPGDAFACVLFGKSTGRSAPMALALMQGASRFEQVTIGPSSYGMAIFSADEADMKRLEAVLQLVAGLRTAYVFVRGRYHPPEKIYNLLEWMRCFANASGCSNPKAHCHFTSDRLLPYESRRGGGLSFTISLSPDPAPADSGEAEAKDDRFLVPCRMLDRWVTRSLDRRIPATLVEQVEAKAIASGFNQCPLFDLSQFRQLPF
jgi:hypothetical protein